MLNMPNKLNKNNKSFGKLLFLGMFLCPLHLFAQITIGGDVYGGGNMGAVGTGNLADGITNETAPENVSFAEGKTATTVVTNVTINGGTVRTVFGGGKNGRTYGSTNVDVTNTDSNAATNIGGTVGGVDWTGTIHGGLFGAGDGASAYVFGNSTVTIEAGTIYQNVYGGGNQAELGGNTLVILQGGDLQGSVFGGARMADIKGYSEVNVDGENIKNDLVVNYVYGGNDISGTTHNLKNEGVADAYVHSSKEATEDKHIFIGQLYAGGNGDYHNSTLPDVYDAGGTLTMVDVPAKGDTPATTVDFNGLNKPVMDNAYLDLKGGTFGYVFGGGNFATITETTDISINNTSNVSTDAFRSSPSNAGDVLSDVRLEVMGLNSKYFHTDKLFNRVFGGNNKVDMAIRPTWHLTNGTIYDLYSGGNEGGMTYPNGIFLPIESSGMTIENVYGGCRKADVNPGRAPVAEELNGHEFQANYAARVLVKAGNINNVYGGNDVSGTVYYGTDLQILSSVTGEVYGGGNGSYIYTDNVNLSDYVTYDDLYYGDGTDMTATNSVAALNAFRPQTEKSYIHVAGTSAKRTEIGKVFGGGNSATVSGTSTGDIHLQLGEYVTIEDVFLGSNGAQMSDPVETLAKYTSGMEGSEEISQMNLVEPNIMATYMEGAAVACMPTYAFDSSYPETTEETRLARIGSFYGGGNVGSMTSPNPFIIAFDRPIIIEKKLVGGCNAATVAESSSNAENVGGFTGASAEKIHIYVDGIVFNVTSESVASATAGNQGNVFGGCFESGVVKGNVKIDVQEDIIPSDFFASTETMNSYLANAGNVLATPLSIFGGGFGEGAIVEGNTTIDINNGGALKIFGGGYGGRVGSEDGAVCGNTTVNLLGSSNVGDLYGGGFEGPITGNAIVNLNGGTAYDVIGGACNAEIGGHTEVYIGIEGFPAIINNVYGANDFGGEIKGSKDFASRVTTEAADKVYSSDLLTASAYVEYIKGKIKYIFGGAKAAYNYKDQTLFSAYADADGKPIGDFVKPLIGNAFVNFRPAFSANSSVTRVYGAGQGYFNERDKDLLQSNSYVLVDVPADVENFAGLEVFGAGDYSGVGMDIPAADVRTAEAIEGDVTAAAVIDLVRGNINSVYGGSYKQGFTRRTIVNVPEGSTIDMNYLYGGAYGVAAADGYTLGNLFPCDVYESNVNYMSNEARVRTIYGGNNSYRRTLYTHVNVYTPVQYVHQTYGLTHANIFGAGYGENTWAQYTEVNLFGNAKVYEVYGGGEAGSVYNKETTTTHATAQGWNISIPGDYQTDDAAYDHGGLDNELANSNQLYTDYKDNLPDAEADGTPDINIAEKYNTNVHLHRGTTVVNYAYGAGLGSHIYTYQFDGNKDGNEKPMPYYYIDSAATPEDLDPEARAKYDSALEAYNTYNSYTSGMTVGANEYNSFNETQKFHWSQIAHRTTAVVSGTSYIDLLGGTVTKDLYAAGTTGAVQDTLRIGGFIASSTAYVKGGTARNIYGGGWEGPVGKHDMSKPGNFLAEDMLGVTNVIVGRPEKDIATAYDAALAAGETLDKGEFYFYNGVPAITRNAYAAGEGGVVRGTANLDMFNCLIGYRFKQKDAITEAEKNYYKIETDADGNITYKALYDDDDLSDESYLYVEEIDQDDVGDNILYEAGNAFGGGYAANSDVDIANITLWNGIIRNSMYGGGEIATIGRGTQTSIYKPGETHVTMWGGHVIRDVFGGGRGFNNWKTEDKTEGNTNGYVFGQTDVNIHIGTIGTPDGLANGYGNVFGGGNIGFVYSQYTKKPDGWYYEDYDSSPKVLSEDTRVEVRVYGKASNNVSIGSTTYKKGDFIPNTTLDQLPHNDSRWGSVDQSGITIYNAVFAGGNVSAGSDKIMAFSKTVYGNSTASVVDIYGRDLISVGGSGVGGLYGDGNLTFVDGYRELNITNYGTDWEYLQGGVTDEVFNTLTPRQQSFYTNQYQCNSAYGIYDLGEVIMSDVYNLMDDDDKAHWTRTRSIVNDGRFINTLQRCDFCGIKGSRIVLHGAIDRAQDESEADYTNYTINRVGELSLNQNHQSGQPDHGNYFGIYNVVKFLGGVTSDVQFAGTGGAVRKTKSTGNYAENGQTYYAWKQSHILDNMRNDGTAPNKIALSSGVFLEIVKNLNTDGSKNYGPITGVVELDLLNVTPGEGGGYVYAKNIHGTPSYTATFADVISDANQGMVTNRAFTYSDASDGDEMQTSGNFIHSQPKTILDDCFPESKSYTGTGASPAHYWYIRGEFYVYEQLVSAYTGASDAYSTEMSIPLTMSIQGNAKLRLLNVVPGLYADPAQLALRSYDADNPDLSVSDSISIIYNSVIKTYGQGDPISYWDWYSASKSDRNMFVVDAGAMVCNTQATFNGRTYYPGEAISASDYNETLSNMIGVNAYGEEVKGDTIFNVINEVNNENGYLLTVDFSNPSKWDDYYRHFVDESGDPIKKMIWAELSESDKEKYVKSATFTCVESGPYGQYYFHEDEIISHSVYEMRTAVEGHVDPATQATFVGAYMAKDNCEVYFNTDLGLVLRSFTKGTPISATDYARITSGGSTYFEPAYICVSTVLVNTGDYRVLNQLVGETEWNSWASSVKGNFQPAYFCTKSGSWGGKYYEEGKNYNGVDYGQLLPDERSHFTYNYDALDALLYNNYVANLANSAYRYETIDDYKTYLSNNVGGTSRNTAISVFDVPGQPNYAISARLDYTATFNSDATADKFNYVKGGTSKLVEKDVELNNDEYESLPNDRKYYSSFAVSDSHLNNMNDEPWGDGCYHVFIIKTTFDVAGVMYNAGKSISHAEFSSLTPQQQDDYVDEVIIPWDTETAGHGAGTYFYCIEPYEIGANDNNVKNADGTDITAPTEIRDYTDTHVYAKGTEVPLGTVIDYNMMLSIPNYQTHFDIQGEVPLEETTLYVPVSADINALQRDRYVTAIYEYSYTESDASGMNFETRVEKHIINIRIKFLSGTPIIGSLKEPELVLPLETVGLDIPSIQEGAFPILGGGWEIYPTEEKAKRHRNGREYINGGEPLYFYQNNYYVAYYALTRMGKTFSDPVPLTVANYQRMADVINDPNHMYINHRDNARDPKIYIDGRAEDTYGNPIKDTDEVDVTRDYSNELDAMQAIWRIVNTSYGTQYSEEVDGDSRNITGASGLEFFLQDEVRSEMPSWTPIGDDTQCFNGTFHGNGNTVTGLNNSLFGRLCGSVYNLGVMGNFTTGGIANTGDGRIENAWVWTSATPSGQAVYANPGSDARVINTYYPDANSAFTGSTGTVEITQRPVAEFVNGSVAYDLNRFYLEARYRLNGQIDGSVTNSLFYRLPDGTLVKDTSTEIEDANGKLPGETGYITTYASLPYDIKYADADYTRFSKYLQPTEMVGYVEKYYDDGDFRFSDGKKPRTADLRLSPTYGYIPLYPDDYIFFGQKLTYGLLNNASGNSIAHATHPQAVAKNHTIGSDENMDNSKHGLLINDITDRSENRVYRAPAYFRNGTYGRSVMFNANAAFIDSYNYSINGTSYTMQPHAQMTAVDFTGGNGDTHGYQGVLAGLATDFKPRDENYLPLLDYERLDGIRTSGLTQNLLAYTPSVAIANTKNTQTHNVLMNYFRDLAFPEDETNPDYRTVAKQIASDIESVKGHLVLQAATTIGSGDSDYSYVTDVDHFLVDKQDFNAPIAYSFSADNRMWYQRAPENFVVAEWSDDPTPVRTTKGWIDICLPFNVELVTTQDKGELTHFYRKDESGKFNIGYDSGHEYWLRKFEGGALKAGDANTFEATFNHPLAGSDGKQYANTFLYDYYYQYSSAASQDQNEDEYQQMYYTKQSGKTYIWWQEDYPYAEAGMPYIVGLPGSTYYEFDLSGNFVPAHVLNPVDVLDPQVITFASPAGGSIAVSDTEMTAKKAASTFNGYAFTPNYLNSTIAAGGYVLNADGSSYEVKADPTEALPFRPYFTAATGGGSGAKEFRAARAITFNRLSTSIGSEEGSEPGERLSGNLTITSKNGRIFVKSGLMEATIVRIVNTGGAVVRVFTIQPGETIETPAAQGIYIVNKKKIVVR